MRIIDKLIAALLVLCLLPATASAETDTHEREQWERDRPDIVLEGISPTTLGVQGEP